MKNVFIDGSAGTTGIQIHERLAARDDINLIILPEEERKDSEARKRAFAEADIAFLCLPDRAAVEAVNWCGDSDIVIIDTSTAHRCADGWTYGFPEIPAGPGQCASGGNDDTGLMRAQISGAKRIANPGCHASGFIALIAPLAAAGMIAPDEKLSCFSVTGYSGGGKKMIAEYEGAAADADSSRSALPDGYEAPRQYGLTQAHKHLPEMARYSMIGRAPVFLPTVAAFRQGMEVSVPLFAEQIRIGGSANDRAGNNGNTLEIIRDIYREAYRGPVVHFEEAADENGFMSASRFAGRDDMEITVTGNDERLVLTARYDNLGKGACGAAIQNLNLVLGIDETTGLNI